MIKLFKAIEFAKEAHKGQKRKGTREPYYFHCLRVCYILQNIGIEDEELLCAAILHDIIEDTACKHDCVKREFGKRVADLVQDVTNQENKKPVLNTKEGTLIKLADMLDNLKNNTNKRYIGKKKELILEILAKYAQTKNK